jgi:ubiquinone biosynthesis UbiH/UbiF/VisC/COQ6 family hydroxylase
VVLVGNAANTVHPVSAQGFNLGLRDVAALTDLAASADDPGSTDCLDRYRDLRHNDQSSTVAYTDTLARAFTNPSLGGQLASSLGLVAHAAWPSLSRRLVRSAMGFREPVSTAGQGAWPMSRDFDVVIAGGGVAGAAAAALLARQGRRVALVDRKRPVAPEADADFDPRVVAISPGSKNVLDHAGGWSRLPQDRIGPYQRMAVHADGGQVEFAASEHGLEHLGWIVEVPVLQAALWKALEDHPDITLMAPASVASIESRRHRLEIRLDGDDRLSARLLVAADGSRSRLRQLAGIEVDEWHYNQRALVCHVQTEKANPGTAWQRFTEHGPLALLPLADGRSSIVWSQTDARVEQLLQLNEQDFLAKLNAHQDSPFGPARQCSPRHALPLVRRKARRLVHGRMVLLGDAARSVHPLAGQGLNLGLADAAALAEVLEDWQAGQDPGPALARYQRWRLSSGAMIGGGIHAINELGHAPGASGRALLGLGFAAAARLWPARQAFVERACGIDSDSPRLAREPVAD